MKRIGAVFLAIVLCGALMGAKHGKKEGQEVDHIALAALMIKDGFYDRAETVLRNVDTAQKGVDFARYHTLRGLILLHRSLYAEARDAFQRAVAAGQQDPVVHLYIAQASYGLKDWKGTVEAIRAAGATAEDLPPTYAMLAQSLWNLEKREDAWRVLTRAEAKHPAYADFTRQKFFYLMELGLYQSAVEEGERYLAKRQGEASDHLLIGAALRQSRQYDKALLILETARVRFPDSEPVMLELARTYLDSGNVLTAAQMFEQASRTDPKFIADAAELYRRARKHYRALHLNTLIADRKERLKQKLAIYLDTDQHELIAGMAHDLVRVGLLDDDEIRYALAYSFFQIGEITRAERELARIQRPEVFRRAAELRREMERCKADPIRCGF